MSADISRDVADGRTPRRPRRVPTGLFVTTVVFSSLLALGSVAFLLVALVANVAVSAEHSRLEAEHADLEDVRQAQVDAEKAQRNAWQAEVEEWVAEGWTYSGVTDRFFYRWAQTDGSDCAEYECAAIDISTSDVPCPSHVSIEIEILSGTAVVGTATERSPGLGAFSDARIWFENRTGQDSDLFQVVPESVECR